MKTADEVAKEIHDVYLRTARKVGWPIRPENDKPFSEIPEESKALDYALVEYITAFAEERMEEEIKATVKRCDDMHKFEIGLARAEALEEALEAYRKSGTSEEVEARIRALKDK